MITDFSALQLDLKESNLFFCHAGQGISYPLQPAQGSHHIFTSDDAGESFPAALHDDGFCHCRTLYRREGACRCRGIIFPDKRFHCSCHRRRGRFFRSCQPCIRLPGLLNEGKHKHLACFLYGLVSGSCSFRLYFLASDNECAEHSGGHSPRCCALPEDIFSRSSFSFHVQCPFICLQCTWKVEDPAVPAYLLITSEYHP